MRFTATVVIHQEDERFIAKCLENSVASHGKTLDEAMDNLREALELYFEDFDDIPLANRLSWQGMYL